MAVHGLGEEVRRAHDSARGLRQLESTAAYAGVPSTGSKALLRPEVHPMSEPLAGLSWSLKGCLRDAWERLVITTR